MEEWKVNLLNIIDLNPVFKGVSIVLVGLAGLLFAWWMRKKWNEPLAAGFIAFIALAGFIVLYGIFILIFQPNWWKPPY